MALFSFFRKQPRLSDAAIEVLCAQFAPEVERLAATVPTAKIANEYIKYRYGILNLLNARSTIDKEIPPIAEANVYLAYQKWDKAIDALERGLGARDDEFAMTGVENPREVVKDLLLRMRQASVNHL